MREKRKLFIDAPVDTDDDLELGVMPFIDELADTVNSNPAPLHIALFGPWGSGKSTVVRALKRRLVAEANQPAPMKVAVVDAWKHRHDSMRRRLILDAAACVDQGLEEEIRRQFYKPLPNVSVTTAGFFSKHWWRNVWHRLLSLCAYLLAAVFATGLIGYIRVWVGGTVYIPSWAFFYKWVDVSADLAVAPVAVAVASYAIAAMTREYAGRGGNVEVAATEQFEERLGAILRALKGKRLLIVIDELDRCPPEQVLDVLEAIRTFMNTPDCSFLVACDRDVLDRAIAVRAESFQKSSQEYLEKIFDVTVTLPPVRHRDMITYAEKLLVKQQLTPDKGDEGTAELKRLQADGTLQILLWSGVTSPRKVKRLLNDFLVRRDLAQLRTLEPCDPLVAKLTVLAQDFPDFLRQLQRYPALLTWMDQVRRGQAGLLTERQSDVCSAWYQKDQFGVPDRTRPHPESERLIRFLGETRKYTWDGPHITKFLYLSDVPEAQQIGPELVREVEEMVWSRQGHRLAEIVGTDPADGVLGMLADQAREAQADDRRDDLLLAMMHLGKVVRQGADQTGTQRAADALAEHVQLFAKKEMQEEVELANVIPYLSFMDGRAQGDWTDLLVEWVKADWSRGQKLFAPECLPLLPLFEPQPPSPLFTALIDWLSHPSSDSHLQAVLPLVCRVDGAWQRLCEEFYRSFLLALSHGDPPDTAVHFLTWYQLLLAELKPGQSPQAVFPAFHKQLETFIRTLPFDDGWFIGHLRTLQERLPVKESVPIVRAMVERAELWVAEPALFSDSLAFIDRQIRDHDLLATDLAREILHHLTFHALQQDTYRETWSFINRYWSGLSPEYRAGFVAAVAVEPKESLDADQLRELAIWLRQHAALIPHGARKTLCEELAAHASDKPERFYCMVAPFIQAETRPFDLPEDCQLPIFKSLMDAAFVRDALPVRDSFVQLLSENLGLFDAELGGHFVTRVGKAYVTLEANPDTLRTGVSAIIRTAGKFHMDEQMTESALRMIETVIERRGDLADGKTAHAFIRTFPLPRWDSEPLQAFLNEELQDNHEEAVTTLHHLERAGAVPKEPTQRPPVS